MSGNEKLNNLISILDSEDCKFLGNFRNPRGVRRVVDLRKRIDEEREQGSNETIERYKQAFMNPEVQRAFELKEPTVEDISPYLNLQNGQVYALCLSDLGPTHSLKDPVISGLFLMNLMTPDIPIEEMDTLADCGIFNSANATKYYAEHFGLNGEYWMPSNMEHLSQKLRSDTFLVHHESEKFAGEEKESKNACYRTLFERLHRDKDFAKRTFYLGHSELGWAAMYPIAQRNAEILKEKGIEPSVLLSVIGAGTFFVPHAEVFSKKFGTKSILGEYEEFCPMTKNHNLKVQIINDMPSYISHSIAEEARKLGNSGRGVISRKFMENPFIPNDFWEKVTESYLGGDCPLDLATVLHFREKGKNIGITTGGVIAVAYDLAQKGETVVIPVYERFKDYTK